jgi:hypothetical protein
MDDNFDKIPVEIGRMVVRHDQGALKRLVALARTTPTTNVTLRIGTGYVSFSTEAVQTAEKRRDDPRVAAAVRRLFAERKHWRAGSRRRSRIG